MNTNNLVKNYGNLSPEERFKLILAASGRGDEAERERLMQSSQRIHCSTLDHSPYMRAFHELLFWTYIELLEDAALFLECTEVTNMQLRESIEVARKRKKTTLPTMENDDVDYPVWHHSGRVARAVGFLLKVKVQGWMLFCARLYLRWTPFFGQKKAIP